MTNGFILVHDTWRDGVVPAEWGDAQVIVYSTRDEAQIECDDANEMYADSARDAGLEFDAATDGLWVEAAVKLADGTLVLPGQYLLFTADELRRITA